MIEEIRSEGLGKLESLLTEMNAEQSAEFGHKRKHTTTITESVKLAETILNRDRVKIQEGILMGTLLSAEDHRSRAKTYQAKADESKAGDKKDAYQAAADAHTKAADCIDAAHQSTAKAELLD